MLSPIDVYRLDLNSRWLGIPTELLMESAGRNVADVVLKYFPDTRRIVCLCSRTNNGGDGLVAARHLSLRKDVVVVFIGRPELIRTRETKMNWDIICRLDCIEKFLVKSEEDLSILSDILCDADVVVDAIFGVGIRGRPRGLEARAIEAINKLKKQYGFKIVSVDVPSGFDCYRGEKTDITIDADIVVTFHDMKKGMDKLSSKIIIGDIGIPADAERYVGPGDLINIVKPRDPWSHKGQHGKILIIGGSKYFTGAPALSALAALKTGADLAVVYAPEKVANTIRSYSPDLIVWSYSGEILTKEVLSELKNFISKFDVFIVGPGLGAEEETLEAVHVLIGEILRGKNIIVDADALKSFSKYGVPGGNIVITPHAGEFRMIFGEEPTKDISTRSYIVSKFARKYDITILLKGHIDVISDGDKTKLNKTGNPGMTVGGTGDVLTGIIGAIMARGFSPFESACAGAFICGYSGDLAFKQYGYGLTAKDVIEHIPQTLNWLTDFISGT